MKFGLQQDKIDIHIYMYMYVAIDIITCLCLNLVAFPFYVILSNLYTPPLKTFIYMIGQQHYPCSATYMYIFHLGGRKITCSMTNLSGPSRVHMGLQNLFQFSKSSCLHISILLQPLHFTSQLISKCIFIAYLCFIIRYKLAQST